MKRTITFIECYYWKSAFCSELKKSSEEFVFDQNNLKILVPFVLWEQYCFK